MIFMNYLQRAREIRFSFPPIEEEDWGFARTKRMLLRTPQSEFMHSAFPVRVRDYYCHNRDFPHEGLSAVISGENYKFLDALCFSLREGSEVIELEAQLAQCTPWSFQVSFKATSKGVELGHLTVKYFLHSYASSPLLQVSCVLEGNFSQPHLWISPLADIREINSESKPLEITSGVLSRLEGVTKVFQGLVMQRNNLFLQVYSRQCLSAHSSTSLQHWHYKLGSGERFENNGTRFIPEDRAVLNAGELELEFMKKGNVFECSCFVSCSKGLTPLRFDSSKSEEKAEVLKAARLLSFSKQLREAVREAEKAWGNEFGIALHARAYCLLHKFNLELDKECFPDAGSMWFREAWSRDLYETLFNNSALYFECKPREFRRILRKGLSDIRKGHIPGIVGGKDNRGVDSALYCIITSISAEKSLRQSPFLERKCLEFIKSLKMNENESVFLDEEGLLRTPAWHSWVDSRVMRNGINVPTRIPVEWVSVSLQDKEAVEGRNYYLVEINALWLRFLHDLMEFFSNSKTEQSSRAVEVIDSLYSSGAEAFRKRFVSANEHGVVLRHISSDFPHSNERSSTAIQALSLLPEGFFSFQELQAVYNSFSSLMVHSREGLFGMLVKEGNEPFYNDSQYHSSVVWPHDHPYLIDLLERIGLREEAMQVLKNSLFHQTNEGAVLYNNELFSLPLGSNPSPSPNSLCPIPVKNPAQYWSSFTQPFLQVLSLKDRQAITEQGVAAQKPSSSVIQ